VPIEVANVRAVTIEATRVYDSNVPQFLQVNGIEGDEQLTRVGTVVWRKRVPVELGPDDNNRWVRLGLDVSQLVAANPNGLYRLELDFQRGDITYPCGGAAWNPDPVDPEPIGETNWDKAETDRSYWDSWEEDGSGMSSWEAYESRDNPCSPGYYRSYYDHKGVAKSKNVLVSDVGLIAKTGEDGDLVAIVNDLKTTAPIGGATLRVLDYQLQPVDTATTDAQGTARMHVGKKGFVVEASANGQKAYAKLDRGSALTLSHFDVSGQQVEGGLKGTSTASAGCGGPATTSS
jgi:uncharacterized protein YfaS (alpha-2-macroglobulin family)